MEHVHIDLSSRGVGRCGLRGDLDEAHRFLDVLQGDQLRKSHFGEGLGQADNRLELTRCRGYHFLARAQAPHFHVLIDDFVG